MTGRFLVVVAVVMVGSLNGMDRRLTYSGSNGPIRVHGPKGFKPDKEKRNTVSIAYALAPVEEACGHIYQNSNASRVTTESQISLINAIKAKNKVGSLIFTERLKNNGEGLNFIDPVTKMSPLIMAIRSDDLDFSTTAVKMLVSLGARLDEPTYNGQNAVEHAFQSNLDADIINKMTAIMLGKLAPKDIF